MTETVKTIPSSPISRIKEILENKGEKFSSIYLEEIKSILKETCLTEKTIRELMASYKNEKIFYHFTTKDGVLCSLWFNEKIGYNMEIIVQNLGENMETNREKLKEIYETRNLKGIVLTDTLIEFLEELFKEEEKPEEPLPTPGIIKRTVEKVKRALNL